MNDKISDPYQVEDTLDDSLNDLKLSFKKNPNIKSSSSTLDLKYLEITLVLIMSLIILKTYQETSIRN